MKANHIILFTQRTLDVIHEAVKEEILTHLAQITDTLDTGQIDTAIPLSHQLHDFFDRDPSLATQVAVKNRVNTALDEILNHLSRCFDVPRKRLDELHARYETPGGMADGVFNELLERMKRS